MGNRAVITTKKKDLAVYLHWNGGRDSVEGLLKYCELRGFRPPERDGYGWARMCQVMGNFFGESGLSVGIDTFDSLEHSADGDNGVYIIEKWEIVAREQFSGPEQRYYALKDVVDELNMAQPRDQQISKEDLWTDLGE